MECHFNFVIWAFGIYEIERKFKSQLWIMLPNKAGRVSLMWYGQTKQNEPEEMTRTVLDLEYLGKDPEAGA